MRAKKARTIRKAVAAKTADRSAYRTAKKLLRGKRMILHKGKILVQGIDI